MKTNQGKTNDSGICLQSPFYGAGEGNIWLSRIFDRCAALLRP